MGNGGKGRLTVYRNKKKIRLKRGCSRKKLEAMFIANIKKSYC